jgi:pimeloyl-ACP methyl ester carboxylesterase
MSKLYRKICAALAVCATTAFAQATAERPAVPGLEHGYVVANGVRLHYVVAGKGEPVLLLHGWPESLVAWSQVIPQLVKAGRRVWAIDYRGAGQSDKPAAGYDLDNVARDVHAFIEAKHLAEGGRGVDVVAHDVGTWIGHALAANHTGDVRRLVLSEALLPGLTPPAAGVPDEAANLRTWQFAFNRLEDLPEILVQGRERAYLAFLFETKSVRRWKIDPATLDQYVGEYSAPGTLRAGFAYYRTNFAEAGLAQARARYAKRLAMPMLAIGGSGGLRDVLLKTLQPIATDAQGAVLDNCGHFLMEECPDEFVRAVTAFWASRR